MTEQTPDPVDAHVGQMIWLRRKQIGQSQSALAVQLGISFQQVQKYERGANRCSASMLVRIARAQELPVADYFDGLPSVAARDLTPEKRAAAEWLASGEAWKFAEALAQLDVDVRNAVLGLARDLGKAR